MPLSYLMNILAKQMIADFKYRFIMSRDEKKKTVIPFGHVVAMCASEQIIAEYLSLSEDMKRLDAAVTMVEKLGTVPEEATDSFSLLMCLASHLPRIIPKKESVPEHLATQKSFEACLKRLGKACNDASAVNGSVVEKTLNKVVLEDLLRDSHLPLMNEHYEEHKLRTYQEKVLHTGGMAKFKDSGFYGAFRGIKIGVGKIFRRKQL
eukprot:TRINITY_DN1113_c0_g4_i1.p1 TRINITY_DN1113_c0_g4~~TRINITY_DN1113_c0_g4_i1.p1  ORF type:complete len:207 (-),score=83.68 TRINITY_DN1113_c0_g4_i1:541-1161(-)